MILKVDKISHCVNNSIVSIRKGMNIDLTPHCDLHFRGCLIVNKEFKSGMAHFRVWKRKTFLVNETRNVCHELKNPVESEFTRLIKQFRIPKKCPVKPGSFCATDALHSIVNYGRFLAWSTGRMNFQLNIKHDKGAESCIKAKLIMLQQKNVEH